MTFLFYQYEFLFKPWFLSNCLNIIIMNIQNECTANEIPLRNFIRRICRYVVIMSHNPIVIQIIFCENRFQFYKHNYFSCMISHVFILVNLVPIRWGRWHKPSNMQLKCAFDCNNFCGQRCSFQLLILLVGIMTYYYNSFVSKPSVSRF